ncbi:hypothetical protein [Pseudobutyrivibrio sp.]|uniref:hypothetical protein n=1 Tax=Pseudobutyrivibrio sp. TaxID=2014367 RepID=UPI003866CEB1
MPRSEAKRRADNKYNLAHYTVLGCKMKITEAEEFKKACKDAGTTPNAIFRKAVDDFMRSLQNIGGKV